MIINGLVGQDAIERPVYRTAWRSSNIAAIPFDEPSDTILDRRRGREADRGLQIRDVGAGFRHVAGLHRYEFALRRAPRRLLDRADELRQLDPRVIADVVEA